MKNSNWTKRIFTLIIPVIISVLIVLALFKIKSPPARSEKTEIPLPVNIMTLKPVPVWPEVSGYGIVEPARTWQAVSETSGKIIYRNPSILPGSFVEKDEILLKIDPKKAELALAKAEAALQSIRAKLNELSINKDNLDALLNIENENLKLSETDLNREKSLLQKKSVAQASVEQKQQAYFQQLSKVQSIKNSLAMIPATEKTILAELAVQTAARDDAAYELEKTIISSPFDCRILETPSEEGQYVHSGSILLKADGIDKVRIKARIPMDRMKALISTFSDVSKDESKEGQKPLRQATPNFSKINAIVLLGGFEDEIRWSAKVIGGDAQLDYITRTLGIIVEVDRPYENMKAGLKPPLIRNMLCEVFLSAPMIKNAYVIPRNALYEGQIYTVNKENRLKFKTVRVVLSQQEWLVIDGNIESGEKIIISDLSPAVENMLLKPLEDSSLEDSLSATISRPRNNEDH